MQKGYSLLESLIVVLILSIGLSLGLPEMHAIAKQQRQKTAFNALMRSLEYAKQRAIVSGKSTSFCLSDDFLHCAKQGGSDLLIYQILSDGGEHYLKRAHLKLGTYQWRGFAKSDGVNFTSAGFVRENGRIRDLSNTKTIFVSRVGRFRVVDS